METEAWRSLSSTAQALYVWLRLEWKGKRFNNNGSIKLSDRQGARVMGRTKNTVNRAGHDLQAKGFIIVTKLGCLGTEGEGVSHEYEITELPLPGQSVGRRLYQNWSPGHDFPVKKMPANRSANQKTKARPNFGDKVVSISGTKG